MAKTAENEAQSTSDDADADVQTTNDAEGDSSPRDGFKEEIEYALGALASASKRLALETVTPNAVGADQKTLDRYLERARENLVDVLAVLQAEAPFFDPWKYGTKMDGKVVRFAELYGDRAYFAQGQEGVGYFKTSGDFTLIRFDEIEGAEIEDGANADNVFEIVLPEKDETKG